MSDEIIICKNKDCKNDLCEHSMCAAPIDGKEVRLKDLLGTKECRYTLKEGVVTK